MEARIQNRIVKNLTISLLIYALPVIALFIIYYLNGLKPWEGPHTPVSYGKGDFNSPVGIVILIFNNLKTWGLVALVWVLGLAEAALGLYRGKWNTNESALDIACYFLPKVIITPVVTYFTLQIMPVVLPALSDVFSWVPFWWGFVIIAIADDLTQYWYHRLHHEVPFLWRFHRTHHSAPYMGMAMASRQNIIYSVFFSQTYLTATLTYLGLGFPALFVRVIKSVIITFAHSSIKWDKPFYAIKCLNPIAWIFERVISTPATHHAHHAASNDDGIGHYKGNFGNMFFLWDVIFRTGIITRKYPAAYGLSYYQGEEWYAQLFWPFVKSKVEGSELSANGPEVFNEKAVRQHVAEPVNEELNIEQEVLQPAY